ncbi:tyrosine-type recombinase/integrase [Synechococcus sp. CCY 0621]|uniref:tyrosine-type recombinase/integrase n=1 Tax=Synechococcus sp. CCY 0621 TaxID=2815603 RepID=UPI001C24A460|nr:tyrosine-type recombinase/integrase [Synechococcus sp. CCY 0621]
MKNDRHGKAAALTEDQLDALQAAAPSPRYACLWAIQRWTAARISEALALTWADINGVVTFRRASTKTKTTRQVPIVHALREALAVYRTAWEAEHGHPPASTEALFPAAGSTTTPQTRQAADKALRATCARLGLQGVSTHSFRRSLAQSAVGRGVPLHVVQKLTGHKSLGSLGEYLSATDAEVLAAIGG